MSAHCSSFCAHTPRNAAFFLSFRRDFPGNTNFPAEKADELGCRNLKLIEEIARRTATIETQVEELVSARKVANKIEDEHAKAIAYHDTVAPMLDTIRRQIDKLELIVDDALWPLPKYRELLFIR